MRSEWAALVNDGFTAGEALTTSWAKLAHVWIIRDGASSSGGDDGRRGQVRPRSEDKGKGGGKGKEKGKGAKGSQDYKKASVDRNRNKICGAFNGTRGCVWNDKQCPQQGKHICSVILPNGNICGSREHGAAYHR